jgi:hypothetical protein
MNSMHINLSVRMYKDEILLKRGQRMADYGYAGKL